MVLGVRMSSGIKKKKPIKSHLSHHPICSLASIHVTWVSFELLPVLNLMICVGMYITSRQVLQEWAKEWQQHKIKMVAKIGVNRTEQNTEMKESITKDSLSTEI